MAHIAIMDEILANKIAAGEVVERTMNVVKELVENALDAKATEIKIDLIDSGVKEVKVTDDGVGMSKDDAILAFSRHATSKLHQEAELFHIQSLGFRGEALPSIAAVSEVTLKTSDGVEGTVVTLKGGKIQTVENGDLRKGTVITVANLFYNTPVRLKYLKNLYIELANIVDYVNKMALSYPDIKFSLKNNDKVLLHTDGSGNLLKVIYAVYGLEVSKKVVPIQGSNDDYEVTGYLGLPEIARSNRSAMTTFVNGRLIKNNELNRVIIDSYHTYIPADKFPVFVINIEVDPILIDINIHPTKMDIKFSKMEPLKMLLSSKIKEALETLLLIPHIEDAPPLRDEVLPVRSVRALDPLPPLPPKEEEIVEEVRLTLEVDEANTPYMVTSTPETEETSSRIRPMHPVGLVHGTYIVAENEEGMYLIDQHAANERINYERFLKEMGQNNHQTIERLVPIKLEYPASDYLILKEHFQEIEALDFTVEEFGDKTLLVRRHPTWLPKGQEEEATRKIFDLLIDKETFSQEKFMEKAAMMMACKLSIKANDYIDQAKMEYLLTTLSKCDNPFTCPHGRPTIITYSNYELEKLFKRAMN